MGFIPYLYIRECDVLGIWYMVHNIMYVYVCISICLNTHSRTYIYSMCVHVMYINSLFRKCDGNCKSREAEREPGHSAVITGTRHTIHTPTEPNRTYKN